ncbi:hypothetical protein BH23VER1_BH23VER1_00440 [soil metagenome]
MKQMFLTAIGMIAVAFAGVATAADEAPASAEATTTYLVSMTGVT